MITRSHWRTLHSVVCKQGSHFESASSVIIINPISCFFCRVRLCVCSCVTDGLCVGRASGRVEGCMSSACLHVCVRVCVMCRKLRVRTPAGRLLSVLLLVTWYMPAMLIQFPAFISTHTHTHTHTQMLAYTLSFPPWCHRFGAPWQQWARKQERMREGKRTDIISCWGDEVVINSSWCSFVSDDGDGRVWWGGGGEDWSPGNIVSLSSGNFRPLRVTPFVHGQQEKLFFPVRSRHAISLL